MIDEQNLYVSDVTSMKPFLFALGRLLVIGASTFGIATAANLANHKGYWHGTIFRVQTTDFNILSHMLPTKLSYALVQGEEEELQSTLNSNYGLFGMVVTNCTSTSLDCPEQQILYLSDSGLPWRSELTVSELSNHPYDLLRNPPPLFAEAGYDNSRDLTWDATGRTNQGEIIGRVYYVRGIPPEFWGDYGRWMSQLPGSLLSNSGAHKYYSLTVGLFAAGGLMSWLFVEWLYQQKRIQRRLADQEKRSLLKELERIRQQLRDRLRQVSELIRQRQQFAKQLSEYQQEQAERVGQLQDIIAQLEGQLANQGQQQSNDPDVQSLEEAQSSLQVEIQQRESVIAQLRAKIASQAKSNVDNTQAMAALQQQLQMMMKHQSAAQQQQQEQEYRLQQLQQQVESHTQEKQEKLDLILALHQQLQDAQQQIAESRQRQTELEDSMKDLNEQKQRDDEKLKKLEDQIVDMSTDLDESARNDFERFVLEQLRDSQKYQLNQWRILQQFDVSTQRKLRQSTDLIVIGKSCIFIIEAKYYLGTLMADGDAKNMPWYCKTEAGKTSLVKSCGGKNPYSQVLGYTDHLMKRVNRKEAKGKIGVFGIVVFPEGTDITSIQSQIDGYYQVATLDTLNQVIEDAESTFLFRNNRKLSNLLPEQIEALICRRPIRKAA